MPRGIRSSHSYVYIGVMHIPCILLAAVPFIAIGINVSGLTYASDALVVIGVVLLVYVWFSKKKPQLRARIAATLLFVLSLPVHVFVSNISGEDCLTSMTFEYLYWWTFVNPSGPWYTLTQMSM